MKKNTDNAEAQARAQLDTLKEMVRALNLETAAYDHAHAMKAEELKKALKGAGLDATENHEENAQRFADDATSRFPSVEFPHDEDAARERIEEDPISIEVRTGWHAPGTTAEQTPEEFCILLCTGGPAVRIRGELDEHGQPTRAWLECQDWGTPWTEIITTGEDAAALLTYSGCFFFGE